MFSLTFLIHVFLYIYNRAISDEYLDEQEACGCVTTSRNTHFAHWAQCVCMEIGCSIFHLPGIQLSGSMIAIYFDIFLIFLIFQGYFADQFRFIIYAIHAAICLLQLILACLVDKRPSTPDTQENKRVPVFIVCFGCVTALSHGVNSPEKTYRELPYHPGHSSPRGLWLPLYSLYPHALSCILHQICTIPCPPVLYRYPTKYLVCPFLVFPSYTYT